LIPSERAFWIGGYNEDYPGRTELISYLSFLNYVDELMGEAHPLISEALAHSLSQQFFTEIIQPREGPGASLALIKMIKLIPTSNCNLQDLFVASTGTLLFLILVELKCTIPGTGRYTGTSHQISDAQFAVMTDFLEVNQVFLFFFFWALLHLWFMFCCGLWVL